MTSQHQPNQKTQDDRYSNHDNKPHSGPIQSNHPQPGPRQEKQVGQGEPEPKPKPEMQREGDKDGENLTPEKDLGAE